MKQLNFGAGAQEYRINDVCTVRFNPADSQFIQRLHDTLVRLDHKQDEYKAVDLRGKPAEEIFAFMRQCDKDMRNELDALFCQPVCDQLFPNMSLCALADGLPVWANFLLVILDEVEAACKQEQLRMNPRVEEYTKKYRR